MPKREKGSAAAAASGRPVSEDRSACSSPLTIAFFEGVLETHSSEKGTTPGARRVGGCHVSAQRMQSEEKEPHRLCGTGPSPKKGRGCEAEGAKTRAHCPAHASGDGAAGRRSNPRFSIFDQEDCVTPLLPLLPVSSVLVLIQVNRLMRKACDSHDLWAHFCLRDFGEDSEKILSIFEQSELRGSPSRSHDGPVVAGRMLYQGVQYKEVYRKMMDYEIELHFISGPMGAPIIKVVGKECVVRHLEAAATQEEDADGPRGVSIGRSRQNDISILQDEMVSRKHGEILRQGISYWFKDVGSINGTFINSEPLHQENPRRLRVDDLVEIGATRFRVHISPPVHDSLRGLWKAPGHAQGSRNKVKVLADGHDCLASAEQVVTGAAPAGAMVAYGGTANVAGTGQAIADILNNTQGLL